MHLTLGSLVLVPFLALSSRAVAADWYVDAAHGSDGNGGTSTLDAWKTIRKAVAAVPLHTGQIQRVHVAPGLYDAANGETFPYLLSDHDAVQLVGDAGPALTTIDAGGAGNVFVAMHIVHSGYTGPDTLVRGFTLRNAGTGVLLGASYGSIYLSLADLVITQMSTAGVTVQSSGSSFSGVPHMTLSRVAIDHCGSGLVVTSNAIQAAGPAEVTFEDGALVDAVGHGLALTDSGGSGAMVVLRRVRVAGNGGDGVRLHQDEPALYPGAAPMWTIVEDSLVARNAGAGVRTEYSGTFLRPTAIYTTLQRCTVVDNAGVGVDQFFATGGGAFQTMLGGTIVFGNGDDVRENPTLPAFQFVSYGDVGDGDFAGSNGNLAVDPLFRDRVAGDYRLAWGSPCVETGDPATMGGTADLLGVKRSVDGDLDAQERADIGAFEFAPLELGGPVRVGGSADLALWGPSGGRAILYFSRGEPMATPNVTFFGDFDLNPTAFRNFGRSLVAQGPPVHRPFAIPNDPAFAGMTFSFQALTSSTVANPIAAYTNPITFTVLP